MANTEQLALLRKDIMAWRVWRKQNPLVFPDLYEATLGGADLSEALLSHAVLVNANLSGVNLSRAILVEANLRGARLSGATLADANLYGAILSGSINRQTDMSGAILPGAILSTADLSGVDLSGADISGADLSRTIMVGTNLTGANLTGCRIYGISTWDLKLEGAIQKNLIVTPPGQSEITVDNIEVGQFIYLLLHNDKIRNVIDTIGEKGVLILGRFTKERKEVLDAIREKLRALNFVPMMFDFEKPTQRDFTETIKTLAGMSRFIIADITNPKSSPLELQAIMPDYMIPFVPIIHEDEEPFAMFRDLKEKYGEWVLDVLEYDSVKSLLQVLEQAVVRPALEKGQQLLLKKAEVIRTRHVRDYI
jgi:hypothetical protein